ncbi:hypothetical protein vBEcoMWL3_gp254 [Escherichia phage vB_EcoM_WL-3]|nr:hypothetical protein vBEcoMWL3_gp254 [Escherichia phage vB_EcoM_WL-3]
MLAKLVIILNSNNKGLCPFGENYGSSWCSRLDWKFICK